MMTIKNMCTDEVGVFPEWQSEDQVDEEENQFCMLSVVGDSTKTKEVSAEWNLGEELIVEDSMSPQLSLHALIGICSFQTMRIRGSKGTRTLYLLINSGSSHNFLDNRLAKQLGCELQTIPSLKISAANGNHLVCKEVCKQFSFKMQGHEFAADFLILPLDNFDMILGIQWLTVLGDIMWNFNKLKMKFSVGKEQFCLQGEKGKGVKMVSEANLQKMLSRDAQLAFTQCYALTIQSVKTGVQVKSVEEEIKSISSSIPIKIARVLNRYVEIFQEPVGLF